MKLSRQSQLGLICALLAAAVFLLYWPAMKCGFVNYDDPDYVTSNAHVKQGLTWNGFVWAWTAGVASNWHPLTWLSHMADVTFYGMNPPGHHFTSVLLHAANAVLLFLVLQSMTGAIWRSALVAALFAVHPIHVESVAWISERKDVLSTLFWLLAVWMYVRYARQRKGAYGWTLVFFACGLMAKPMVVTLPFVLLLLDYWPLKRLDKKNSWRRVREKIPFLILAAISSAITVIVQRKGGAVTSIEALSFGQRLANAFISYVRYLIKTVWPLDLAILYPHPRNWPVLEVIGAALFLAAVTWLVVWRARRFPYLAVGWLWFAGMLVPVIGLVQVGIQSMADRYSYMPIVGIFIAVTWGGYELLGKFAAGRWILGGLAAVALAFCAALTPRQVEYWTDSLSLFKRAVAVTKDNYLAYNNIGFYLSNNGKTEEAMNYFRSSIAINPNYEEAHNNLGYALANLGRNSEATNEYIKALSINRKLTEAHNNLGNALSALGLSDEAMHEYEVALEENPHHAQAHNNLGIALATHGRLDEAIEQFRMAIRDQPDYSSAHSDLGNALAMKGKFDQAIEQYELCLKLEPKEPQVHNNLGNVYAQQGKLDAAVKEYRTALELKPDNPETHFNLSVCLSRQGHLAEARAECEQALAQRPDYPEARNQLNLLKKASP